MFSKKIVLYLVLLCLLSLSAKAQSISLGIYPKIGSLYTQEKGTLICHARGIAGLGEEHRNAKSYIGLSTTRSFSEIKAFVTIKDDSLYIDSNFIPLGQENPTKINTSEKIEDFHLLTKLLVHDEAKIKYEDIFNDAFEKEMIFYIEQRVFSHPRYKSLNFGSAKRVMVVGQDRVARPTKLIKSETGQPTRLVEYLPSLYGRAEVTGLTRLVTQLSLQRFNPEMVRFLSLVKNPATNQTIRELIPSANQVPFDFSSGTALNEALANNRNSALYLLGHIEGDAVVILDAANKELLRVSVLDLQNTAASNNIDLFILGCNSATVDSNGVAAKFNSIDAVKSFSRALKSSKTNLEFLTNLSSDDLPLVIDHSILKGNDTRIRISVINLLGVGVAGILGKVIGQIAISGELPDAEDEDKGPKKPDDLEAREVAGILARALSETKPNDGPYYYSLGWSLIKKERYVEAEREFREAVKQVPKMISYRTSLGIALHYQKKFIEAESEYKTLMKIDPETATSHYLLGRLYLDQNRHSDAIFELKEAIKRDPNNPASHNQLGIALLRQEMLSEAEGEFRTATQLDTKTLLYRCNLGIVLKKQGKFAEAEVEFKLVLELDPNDKIAQKNLQELLQKK